MKEEKLIKSVQRVKDHGEVFTPDRIVKQMLDQKEFRPGLTSLTATILEPAAGEGAFLTEVLIRKLSLADRLSTSIDAYGQNALIALASLYGIELLVDNTELLVMHMYHVFYREYARQVKRYRSTENPKIIKSAMVIIKSNMVQGDALTGKNKDDKDIIFSEWKLLPTVRGVQKIQRTEYTLDAIMHDGPSLDGKLQMHGVEQISLFELNDGSGGEVCYKYAPVKVVDVYKETKIEVKAT